MKYNDIYHIIELYVENYLITFDSYKKSLMVHLHLKQIKSVKFYNRHMKFFVFNPNLILP